MKYFWPRARKMVKTLGWQATNVPTPRWLKPTDREGGENDKNSLAGQIYPRGQNSPLSITCQSFMARETLLEKHLTKKVLRI